MKLTALRTKMEFKAEQDKVEKCETHDLIDFLGKKMLLVIKVLPICLFINQYLVR